MIDHPHIDQLPPVIEGVPVREPIREIFRDPKNGTPDNISRAGCLALAMKSNQIGGTGKGHLVWNAWRQAFPNLPRDERSHDYDLVRWTNRAQFGGNSVGNTLLVFSSFEFGDGADFSNAIFGDEVNFEGAKWGDGANFQSAQWGSDANFRNCEWGAQSNFFEARWGEGAFFTFAKWGPVSRFSKALWADFAHFESVMWGDNADFIGANWGSCSNFDSATWGRNARLRDAVFGDFADFTNTHWQDAKFSGVTFGRTAKFIGATWAGDAVFDSAQVPISEIDFSESVFEMGANFLGRKFQGTTLFSNARFGQAPLLHGCELHQDTSFEGAKFPKATGSEEAARAYRTLKLAFSKQQAIREEQRFFRLEMEEETLRETGLKRVLFKAYKFCSDYGFSVVRPLVYGGVSVLMLTALYGFLSWLGQCGVSLQACHFAPQWLEFSLLQTLPLPGLDKLVEEASKVFWPSGAWWGLALSVLVVFHKTISLAMLFLVGLAIRNLFKLK